MPARFALLFAAEFAALGILMPFLPAVLAGHGMGANEIAALLATGSAVRLLAAPLLGRGADGLGEPRRMLVLATAAATFTVCGYGLGGGFLALLAVAALHAMVSAPIIPLSDAICLAATRREGFDYGRVRSAGSISFIVAVALAGQAVERLGLNSIVWAAALCFAATAFAASRLPPLPTAGGRHGGFRAPFADAAFRRLLPVSALIQGSHALFYGFGALYWQQAGLSAGLIGALWAEGVIAEVALFLWGRPLADRLGARGLALLAALAGLVRWLVFAETVAVPALALAQLLHAATFGMMHLAAMRVLVGLPTHLAATAQTLHASLGVGLTMGVLTLLSGPVYEGYGGQGFLAMAALCVLAIPLAWRLPVR